MTAHPSPATTPIHWCVVGTGALSTLWVERLVAAGEHVSVYSRHASDPDPLTLGVQRNKRVQQFQVPRLPAQAPATNTTSHTRIWLIMVKAWQLEPALSELKAAGWLGPRETLILSHNGLGAADVLLQHQTGWFIYDLVTTQGAWRPERTLSVHAGKGESWLGPRYSAMHDSDLRTRTRAREHPDYASAGRHPHWFPTLAQALPPVEWDPSVYYKRLEKLAINCAINPLATLANGVNGVLRGAGPQHEGYDDKIQAICDEVATLYPELQAARLYERVQQVLRATAGNHCSMLQDIQAGRRTEIDYLNGHICARGQRREIPTPLNCELANKIRLLERQRCRA